MKIYIILEKEDGSEIALETNCIRQIETSDLGGRCYVYHYNPRSSEVERICVIGAIKDLVEKINEIDAEWK